MDSRPHRLIDFGSGRRSGRDLTRQVRWLIPVRVYEFDTKSQKQETKGPPVYP
jgi:hypothetical protein